MNCIIPGVNMKIMGRAVQALSRIGDEMYLEAYPDKLVYTVLNMNKTAYATFEFTETFFSSYDIDDDNNDVSQSQDQSPKCKINVKAMLSVFKSPTLKEKKVDVCKIELGRDADNITFKLRYKNEITSVHKLHLIDMEFLTIAAQNKETMNQVMSSSGFYTQMLSNFQQSDDTLSLEVGEARTTMRNYDPGETNTLRHIRSQIVLSCGEFNVYKVADETTITFAFRPFRSALQFAEFFNLNVSIYFTAGGRPAIVTVKNVTFEANFVISTIRPDGSTQSTATTTRTSRNVRESSPNNMTIQDRQALESIDWDNDVDEMDSVAALGAQLQRSPEPESPQTKRMKLVFQRCFEPTFSESRLELGNVLAENSDPDCNLSDLSDGDDVLF